MASTKCICCENKIYINDCNENGIEIIAVKSSGMSVGKWPVDTGIILSKSDALEFAQEIIAAFEPKKW